MASEEITQTRLTPIFLVVAIVFGLALVGVCHQVIKQCAVNQHWDTTQGIVTKVSTDGWWNDQEKRRYYLEYAYTYQGRKYTGYRYHLQDKSLKSYGGIQYRYKQGDPIKVYFDASNPEQAVLNADYLRDWFISIAVLVGILVWAVTVLIKESNDRRVVSSVADFYDGSAPLPRVAGLEDTGALLKLNTGMSPFWRIGITFFAGCFIGITPLLLGTNAINPGWSIKDYGVICLAIWGGAACLCLIISVGLSFTLYVDVQKREIREERRVGFSRHMEIMEFSQVAELRLYRELWRHTNPLRNWIMFIQGVSGRSITVSRGYRDYQVANSDYLGAIKARIEHLVAK